MNDLAVILDVETTGTREPVEPIEVAYLVVDTPASQQVTAHNVERFCPSKPIECGALATHHILDETLALCRPSREAALPPGTRWLIGHNIDYDWKALGSPPHVHRICTMALARRLWPECDSHRLGALLYYLDRERAPELTANAHDALADCGLVLELLCHIVARFNPVPDWATLYRASEKARVPTHWPFGNHKDAPIASTPRDYLEWADAKMEKMDEYLRVAVRRALGRAT